MKEVKCPNCGAKIHKDITNKYKCEYCGSVFDDDEKCSQNTTANIAASSYITPVNNYETSDLNAVSSQSYKNTRAYKRKLRKKITAIILCVLLGWLGIHHFYQEHFFRGVLYLLTYGLFGIGIIIDLIILIVKPIENFN